MKKYKVKKQYLNKTIKGGGVTIELTEDIKQSHIEFVMKRFDDKYFSKIKEDKVKDKKDDNNKKESYK